MSLFGTDTGNGSKRKGSIMKLRPLPKGMARILYELYNTNECYKRWYPKAAKKKRILKKWLNRFGPDANVKDMVYSNNPFMVKLP
jgi:hypothetical protein